MFCCAWSRMRKDTMFTGIIEHVGTVVSLEQADDSAYLTLEAGPLVADLPPGGSLAVNGVCLTSAPPAAAQAEEKDEAPAGPQPEGTFRALLMGETLRRSSLGALQPGDPVNLERCMPAGGRFDGHIVQGHVDGVGHVASVEDNGLWRTVRVNIPADLAPYTVEKGSISLSGTSLTLTAVSPSDADEHWVEVGLIEATLERTIFGQVKPGHPINIEADILAKYAERRAEFTALTPRKDQP